MIWESSYWKDTLLKEAAHLRRRAKQNRWPEASLARLEQSVMLGFYLTRKLIEAKKLSDSTVAQSISLQAYPWNGNTVTLMNWHHFERFYDLENPKSVQRDLHFLCNQFIHSYIFSPVMSGKSFLAALLVSSDRERQRFLYQVELADVIAVFEQVGTDYPNSVRMTFDPERRDYNVTSSQMK